MKARGARVIHLRLPSWLRIGSRRWSLHLVPHIPETWLPGEPALKEGEAYWGICQRTGRSIRILDRLSPRVRFRTAVHECLHASFPGLGDEDDAVHDRFDVAAEAITSLVERSVSTGARVARRRWVTD